MKGSCTSLRKRVGDVFSHEAKARNLSQEAFADHDVLRRAQNGFVEEGGGGVPALHPGTRDAAR